MTGHSIPTFTINLDKKCAECRQGGVADNGLCLKCTTRAISGRVMKTSIGKAVQQRFFAERQK